MSLKSISPKLIVDSFEQLQRKGTLCDTILELSDGSIYFHSTLLLASFPSFQPYLVKQSLPDITSLDRPIKLFLLELFQLNLEDGRKFINTIYALTSNRNHICVINYAKQCLESGEYDTKKTGALLPVTPKGIMTGLSDMQQRGTLCDTIINFSNGSIYVHSLVILAISQLFKKYFQVHHNKEESINIDRPTKRYNLEILGLGLEEGRKFVNAIYGKSNDVVIINKVLQILIAKETINDENNISTTIESENIDEDNGADDMMHIDVFEMKDDEESFEDDMNQYNNDAEDKMYYAVDESGDASSSMLEQVKQEKDDEPHERSYECHVCGMRFGRLIPFRRHFARHEMAQDDADEFDDEMHEVVKDDEFGEEDDEEDDPDDLGVVVKQEPEDSEDELDFTCIHCNKKCTSKLKLKNHMRQHTGERRFRCSVCQQCFVDRYPLDRHMVAEHPEIHAYKCIQCNETFQMKRMLKEHSLSIHGNMPLREEKSYVCEICSKIFKAKYLLLQHQVKHSKDTPFECELCELAFKKKSRLTRHYNEMHRDVSRPYCCSQCGDTFDSNNSLSNHIGQKHKRFGEYTPKTIKSPLSKKAQMKMMMGDMEKLDESTGELITSNLEISPYNSSLEDKIIKTEIIVPRKIRTPKEPKTEIKKEKPIYNCPKCCRFFTNHSALNNHLRGHNDSVSHMCQICGNTYRSLYGVRQHLKVQHQLEVFVDGQPLEKPKKVFCERCGKGFSKPSKLKSHEALHNDDNPFRCDKCESVYRSKSNLLKHHQVKHSSLRPYECNICRKTFAINTYLWEHMKIHLSVKPYVCELCGKRFGKKSILQIHERCIHSGVSPYACQVCEKRFKTTSSLWKHVQTHNERRNYPCSMCEKKFYRHSRFTAPHA